MRHRVAGRRLGRDTGHRNMLRRNLITELFRNDKIKTTSAKAKAVRAEAEKMITLARNRGDAERLIDLAEGQNSDDLGALVTKAQAIRLLNAADADDEGVSLEREANAIAVHAQRTVGKKIKDHDVLYKLFHEIAPRYLKRPGGYTRLVKMGPRHGDNAEMVMLMLVEEDE